MPATLGALLADARFHLEPVTPIPQDALDAPLTSAHSSDLPDPTPWLEPGQLLLTDGVQFLPPSTDADDYVARLLARGIRALGFATQIMHDTIPPSVVEACARQDLPLVEVKDRTPFMAIIRYISDALAAEQRARLEASLASLRAVARAALRPDGLREILRELEGNLHCWVALYDAAGDRVDVRTRLSIPAGAAEAVQDAVRRALRGKRPAGLRLALGADGDATLQTIGRTGLLRGVLAVGTGATLDRAGNDLVESVIALASIALEQRRAVDDVRRRLRSGIAELLLVPASVEAARAAVRPLWGDLPPEPIRVALADPGSGTAEALVGALEVLAERRLGEVFFAERDGRVLIVVSVEAREAVDEVLASFGAGAGFSAPAPWSAVAGAVDEAERAASRLDAERRSLDFETLADAGILGHLEATGAHAVARRMLQPLLDADGRPRGELLQTLEVWLQHNGAWDPAAKQLGIHRHTLRARVDAAGALLGLDLSTFGARAELWQALRLR